MNDNLMGKTLVLTTTNGTKAINVTDKSKQLLIGSFLNLDALCKYLIDLNKNVLLLGSGWQNKFCLEDSICAGAISDQLLNSKKFETSNDSTVAARYLFLSAKSNYFGFLKASSHRKRLKKLNLRIKKISKIIYIVPNFPFIMFCLLISVSSSISFIY